MKFPANRFLVAPLLVAALLHAPLARALPAADEDTASVDAITHALEVAWHSAATPLAVGPVVVVGDHAIADWQQGTRGGRALMAKSAAGWQVVLCAGDALLRATFLQQAGISAAESGMLVTALAHAEASLDATTRHRLSMFDGTVRHHP